MEEKHYRYFLINPRNAGRKPGQKQRPAGKRILWQEKKPDPPVLPPPPPPPSPPIKVTHNFVITKRSGILHDRECFYVRRIRHGRQINKIELDTEVRFCKWCQRKAVIRNGAKDVSDCEICEKFFDEKQVSTSLLTRLFVEKRAQAKMLPVGIRIYCGDDCWRIRWKSTEGASVLEHNNYVRTLAGERYFTKGYHEQHIRPNTVTSALHCLMAYDYQAYHGEAAKERKGIQWEQRQMSQ